MKTSKSKWVLIAALAVPGMMMNSCFYGGLLREVRDSAAGAVGDFTHDTTLNLLTGSLNLGGTQ